MFIQRPTKVTWIYKKLQAKNPIHETFIESCKAEEKLCIGIIYN
jgi:hypothetical protein